MAKFFNSPLSQATNQARSLRKDNMGHATSGFVFSLTGLGFAGLGSFMFLTAGFNIHSSSFGTDFLKALMIF